MMAEYHPLIACSISFVLCFCVYANFSCTVCYEMFKLKKIKRVLPSETLSKTPDLENFASACRTSKRVTDLARERWTLRE